MYQAITKISGGSPRKGRAGEVEGPTWTFCPGVPEFIVTPVGTDTHRGDGD